MPLAGSELNQILGVLNVLYHLTRFDKANSGNVGTRSGTVDNVFPHRWGTYVFGVGFFGVSKSAPFAVYVAHK